MIVESILAHKGNHVTTISLTATIKSAAERMREQNIAALVVMRSNDIIGVLSERDIVHAFARHGDVLASMTVREILPSEFVTIAPQDDLKRAMTLMTDYRTRHLVVLRGGKLAGIISIGDVVKYRVSDLELESNVLRDLYIATH
jgi:CBS domain-containing protein